MKNSKVVNVQSNGTWKNNEGKIFYKYEIEMENGDVGEYSSISNNQDKFIVGQQTNYQYTDGKFPKVKPVYMKPDSFNQSSPKQDVNVNNTIARAVAFKGSVLYDTECTQEDVLKNAKFFYDNWLSDDYTDEGKIDMIKKSFDAQFKGTTPDDIPF